MLSFMGAPQIDSNELPAMAGTSRYLPPAAPSVAAAQPLRRSRHGQWRLTRTTLPRKNLDAILVGGFNPSEKYARQIGDHPQVGVEIKNI